MTTLPVLPTAFPDECPAGFLLRVAHRNGWANPNVMISALGGRVEYSAIRRELLLDHFDLLSLVGVDIPEALFKICSAKPSYPKRYTLVAGVDLPPAAFREDCSAVCPHCLKVSPYVRQLWSLGSYLTCHIHGVRMLHSCPKCKAGLSYHRAAPHVCSCGADFTEMDADPGDILGARAVFQQVEKGMVEDVAQVSKCYQACCESFGNNSLDADVESQYLRAALMEQSALGGWLADHARFVMTMAHPRLLLLPFLRTPGRMRNAALDALRILDNGNIEFVGQAVVEGTLTRLDASYALGLNSHRVIAQLGKGGLLSEKAFDEKARGAVISRNHVNLLLCELYRSSRDSAVPIRAQTTRLSNLIRAGRKEPDLVMGYDLAAGLNSLRIRATCDPKDMVEAGYLSLSKVAALLSVHKDVVRTASRLGLVAAKEGRRGTSPMVFDESEVIRFNKQFVFASALARSIGAEPMKFSTKLFAAGVKPVAGPAINGLQLYLFARKDLTVINLQVVAYGQAAPFTAVTNFVDFSKSLDAAQPSLSIKEIGADLSLPHTDVSKIVRSGCLKRVVVPGREVRVCKTSYASFAAKFSDANLIEFSAAAVLTGETLDQFKSNWIDTKLLTVTEFGIKRCIAHNELMEKLAFRTRYLTAREAVSLTKKGRHLLPNLESRGEISSIREGTGRKIRLFDVGEAQRFFW